MKNGNNESILSSLRERIIDDDNNNIFPSDVAIETTGLCNFNCIMCFRDKITRKKTKMRWPLYIKIINEIAEKAKDNTRVWLCFAGEPLMSGRDFIDRVIYAKSKGIKKLVINSNMSLMKKDLAEEIIKAGLNTVFVGLDAATSDVYSRIRRGGDFENVVKNTIEYKNILDRVGKKDQNIVIQFIEMPLNYHQREDVIDFWSKYGIVVKVRPMVTWQAANNLKNDLSVNRFDRVPCHWIMNIFPVTAEGLSVWCGCDYNGESICGDLNNNSIEEIWTTIKKVHRNIQIEEDWNKLPVFCFNCEDWRSGYAEYAEIFK